MKKIIFTLIAAALIAALTACSGSNPQVYTSSAAEEPVSVPSSEVQSEVSPESVPESAPETAESPEPEYEKAEFSSLKVINNLGFTVTGLYLSPTHANTWEENVLSDKTLPSGYSIDVSFPEGENARYWDVRIVGESKQEIVWYEFDLQTIGTLDLIIKDGQMTAETYNR